VRSKVPTGLAQHYELIVTSSGSAGCRAAVQAAKLNETSTTLLDVDDQRQIG
jgi:hypothetical protein